MRPRRSLAVVGIILVALGVGLALVMLVSGNPQETNWATFIVPGVLLYFALIFGLGIPYKCRRAFSQRKDLQRPCTFHTEEKGLRFSTEGISGTKAWSDYFKWKEGKNCFLIYMSDNMYQVIPKRFLESESEVRTFREILQRNVARREA
jgi:hypothetical protein